MVADTPVDFAVDHHARISGAAEHLYKARVEGLGWAHTSWAEDQLRSALLDARNGGAGINTQQVIEQVNQAVSAKDPEVFRQHLAQFKPSPVTDVQAMAVHAVPAAERAATLIPSSAEGFPGLDRLSVRGKVSRWWPTRGESVPLVAADVQAIAAHAVPVAETAAHALSEAGKVAFSGTAAQVRNWWPQGRFGDAARALAGDVRAKTRDVWDHVRLRSQGLGKPVNMRPPHIEPVTQHLPEYRALPLGAAPGFPGLVQLPLKGEVSPVRPAVVEHVEPAVELAATEAVTPASAAMATEAAEAAAKPKLLERLGQRMKGWLGGGAQGAVLPEGGSIRALDLRKPEVIAAEGAAQIAVTPVASAVDETAKRPGMFSRLGQRMKSMLSFGNASEAASDVVHVAEEAKSRPALVVAGLLATVGGAAWLSSGEQYQRRETQRRINAMAAAPEQGIY